MRAAFITALVTICVTMFYIAVLCWEYTLNFWLAFSGSENTVEIGGIWWLVLVPGIGQLSIPAAAFTYIFSMFQ